MLGLEVECYLDYVFLEKLEILPKRSLDANEILRLLEVPSFLERSMLPGEPFFAAGESRLQVVLALQRDVENSVLFANYRDQTVEFPKR
mmetsp:Transcript_33542/g.54357  ORF Transcript_33542/g.54357 Transcript_33542/m.54357 type:complete len:89 (+) Transcript_33542:3050-3316(+)